MSEIHDELREAANIVDDVGKRIHDGEVEMPDSTEATNVCWQIANVTRKMALLAETVAEDDDDE